MKRGFKIERKECRGWATKRKEIKEMNAWMTEWTNDWMKKVDVGGGEGAKEK